MLCLCLNLTLFSQNNTTTIKSNVQDAQTETLLEFSSAVLLTESNNTIIRSYITNEDGVFTFKNILVGNYKLIIAFTGYIDYEQKLQITANQDLINIGTVTLKKSVNELNAAVITSKTPKIKRKIDKLVMTVEGSVSSEGNNALEVLKQAPGVTVDQDGKVILLGSDVLVQIDGRNTYLSSTDLSTLLNGMDASEISKIEIINNPSSKQDASGSSGIINICTRKTLLSGINGIVNSGIRINDNFGYQGGIRLNYRNSWLGVFGSYNYYNNKNINDIDQIRRYNQAKVPYYFESFTKSNFNWQGGNYRFGLDFYINPKNTLGFLVTGNHNNDKSTTNAYTSEHTIKDNILLSKSNSNNSRTEKNNGITLNANYSKLFNKEDQEFKVV